MNPETGRTEGSFAAKEQMFTLTLIAVALLYGDPISAREPSLPESLDQTFEARCGSNLLSVRGHGPRLPLGSESAEIYWDGRAVEGPSVDALRRDLSRISAAYRLSARCLPPGEGFWFGVHVGENVIVEGETMQIEYHSAGAIIRDGQLVSYTGLDRDIEGGFWFR